MIHRGTFHGDLRNRRADGPRPFHGPRAKEWRHHHDSFTAHYGLGRLNLLDVVHPFDAFALERLPAARAQFVIVRALVHDRRIVIGDVRDVGRLIDDRYVPLRRNHSAPHILVADVLVRNEDVLAGVDIIITIGPLLNPGASLETRFGRERSPADMLLARAP